MSESENNYDSDEQVSENHSKLVDAVRQLDKRPSFKKADDDLLNLATLQNLGCLVDEDSDLNNEKRKVNGKSQSKSTKSIQEVLIKKKIPKPLEKLVETKIKRKIGYEETKKDLTKWTGIIARNRTAASLSFPISQSSMKLVPSSEFTKKFRLQSELEKKLEELEPEKEPEVEEDKFKLTYEEMLERRKEAAKLRAQQSYNAAKARRQNKIKSKKFHRIQKKEKVKKVLKEFEELQKTDPQAALEKLEEIDKARAHERMTLRHKSTGQWAKNKQIRAKYDKESRQVLAEQLSISRELTQKLKKKDDSDEDEDDDENDQQLKLTTMDKDNPWMNGTKSENEVDQFISSYRKFWDEKNKKEKDQVDKEENQNNYDSNLKTKEKAFIEPEIQNLILTPTKEKKVSFENLSDEEKKFDGSKIKKSVDSKIPEKNKTIKKLQKVSKNKLGIKNLSNKIKKTQKIVQVGTSNWNIDEIHNENEPANSDTSVVERKNNNKSFNSKLKKDKDIDLDEMFDSMENKIQEKIQKKLPKIKKLLEAKTKKEKKKNKTKKKDPCIDDVEKLGLRGQKNVRPIIDKPNEESINSQPENTNLSSEKIMNINSINQATSKEKKTEIDPNKFMNIKPKIINTMLPDEAVVEGALDDSEEEEDQQKIISEAFADDDIVDEFRKEKEEEIKNSQPQDIDLTLPGWGSWGGTNIKVSNRKRRRFIMKFPKEVPRRDENKGDVVIIEEKCPKIKKHLVSELPFPFNSVQDYEASIRAPIGRDFVPEKAFSKFIQPAVKTKMGKIIEPMSEESLVKKTEGLKKRKKPTNEKKDYGKKKKGNNANKVNNRQKKSKNRA